MMLENYELEITPEQHHVTIKVKPKHSGSSEFMILSLLQVYELQKELTKATAAVRREQEKLQYKPILSYKDGNPD